MAVIKAGLTDDQPAECTMWALPTQVLLLDACHLARCASFLFCGFFYFRDLGFDGVGPEVGFNRFTCAGSGYSCPSVILLALGLRGLWCLRLELKSDLAAV